MSEIWHSIQEFFAWFQPRSIIEYGGLLLLLTVVFIENGLFFGFFLPGDSLMFAAGLLCATGVLPHPFSVVISSVFIMAVIGNMFGYYFGRKTGPALYSRKESFFFRKSHLQIASEFYTKHGLKTLIIGRFLPVIRTFAPIVAGLINMHFGKFMLANILGAAAWVGSLVSLGYFLGNVWPDAEKNLGYIIIALIIITAIPVVRTYLKNRGKGQQAASAEGEN
ncbi:MAG: DedA family protein [Bacteroidetes bacterium]|nr:DedA family protein [Bacteroidota bacterium]